MGAYKNVMELLVEEEIVRQCRALPSRVAVYLNPEELLAYALNQLPALYATSEQGLEYQIQKGKAKHGAQIEKAVQRAIAAVRRDPLRRYTPLSLMQTMPLRDVLNQIRRVLKNDQLDWESVPTAVEQALKQMAYRAAQGNSGRTTATPGSESATRSTWTARMAASPHPVAPPPPPTPQSWIPPTHPPQPGRSIAPESAESFDWNDPLYYSH